MDSSSTYSLSDGEFEVARASLRRTTVIHLAIPREQQIPLSRSSGDKKQA
jgi:hypothetical protein